MCRRVGPVGDGLVAVHGFQAEFPQKDRSACLGREFQYRGGLRRLQRSLVAFRRVCQALTSSPEFQRTLDSNNLEFCGRAILLR